MPDASAVMQLLLKTQTDFNDLEDDDPQVRGFTSPSHALTDSTKLTVTTWDTIGF